MFEVTSFIPLIASARKFSKNSKYYQVPVELSHPPSEMKLQNQYQSESEQKVFGRYVVSQSQFERFGYHRSELTDFFL